jgi:hypothetical protein
MYLTTVTITGIDENIDISRMIELSKRFPFVEWGILISANKAGTDRYPRKVWVEGLVSRYYNETRTYPKLAYHLCGKVSSCMLVGNCAAALWDEFVPNFDYAGRIQVNVNVNRSPYNPRMFAGLVAMYERCAMGDRKTLKFIVQHNKNNERLWFDLVLNGVYPNILFDTSGGRGLSLRKYLPPIAGLLCGYAGGISPENIKETLGNIDAVVYDGLCWIDMESGVRTDNKLDFDKVEQVLEIAEDYMLSI